MIAAAFAASFFESGIRSKPFSPKKLAPLLPVPPIAAINSASLAPPIISDSTAACARVIASLSCLSSWFCSACFSCSESSSYFFISSCRRELN